MQIILMTMGITRKKERSLKDARNGFSKNPAKPSSILSYDLTKLLL